MAQPVPIRPCRFRVPRTVSIGSLVVNWESASIASHLNFRVEVLQSDAGVAGDEVPVHADLPAVAVQRRLARRGANIPPPALRLQEQPHIADPRRHVFVVQPGGTTRTDRKPAAGFRDQLLRLFSQADHRMLRIVRPALRRSSVRSSSVSLTTYFLLLVIAILPDLKTPSREDRT